MGREKPPCHSRRPRPKPTAAVVTQELTDCALELERDRTQAWFFTTFLLLVGVWIALWDLVEQFLAVVVPQPGFRMIVDLAAALLFIFALFELDYFVPPSGENEPP